MWTAFLALSVAIAAGAIFLAWSQARRAIGSPVDLPKLAAKLKRSPLDERPSALVELAPAGSWEHRLGEELLATAPGEARVVAANEALDDLSHELDARSDWPRAAAYIGMAGCCFCGFVDVAIERDQLAALQLCVPGIVAAFACLEARRRAKAGIHRRKVEVDGLIDVLMGAAAREHALASASRRRRRRDF